MITLLLYCIYAVADSSVSKSFTAFGNFERNEEQRDLLCATVETVNRSEAKPLWVTFQTRSLKSSVPPMEHGFTELLLWQCRPSQRATGGQRSRNLKYGLKRLVDWSNSSQTCTALWGHSQALDLAPHWWGLWDITAASRQVDISAMKRAKNMNLWPSPQIIQLFLTHKNMFLIWRGAASLTASKDTVSLLHYAFDLVKNHTKVCYFVNDFFYIGMFLRNKKAAISLPILFM